MEITNSWSTYIYIIYICRKRREKKRFVKLNTTIRYNASKFTHYKLELAALDRGIEKVSRKLIGFTCINGGIRGFSVLSFFRIGWNRFRRHVYHTEIPLLRVRFACASRGVQVAMSRILRDTIKQSSGCKLWYSWITRPCSCPPPHQQVESTVRYCDA